MGDPSESSSEEKMSTAILTRLEKISVTLDKLLDVSLELLQRFQGVTSELQRRREAQETSETGHLPDGIGVSTLLDLPDHLRKPLMALFKLGGRGTAAQVGEKIGISRPQASATLNSLVQLKLLVKKREGKEGRRGADAVFMIPDQKRPAKRKRTG